jgi:glycerol uptake facilitator-like aquaporin
MATRKSATSSKKAPKRAVATKKTTTKVTTVSAKATPARVRTSGASWTDNLPNILVAELVGTFVLTTAALLVIQLVAPLYVGLTLAVLVFAIGAVSGSHVNPAVSFALWTMRRLDTKLLPFYWIAQFLGAFAAIALMTVVAGAKLSLDFSHFGTFSWSVFAVELVGTAVFLFGLTAVLLRDDIKPSGKALGIGLSFTVGLVIATSMYASVSANIDQSGIKQSADEKTGAVKLENVPHEMRVSGATLNPAIALATSEKTDTELTQGYGSTAKDEKLHSRLSWEVILSTLVGAALGGNLYLLLNNRLRR